MLRAITVIDIVKANPTIDFDMTEYARAFIQRLNDSRETASDLSDAELAEERVGELYGCQHSFQWWAQSAAAPSTIFWSRASFAAAPSSAPSSAPSFWSLSSARSNHSVSALRPHAKHVADFDLPSELRS